VHFISIYKFLKNNSFSFRYADDALVTDCTYVPILDMHAIMLNFFRSYKFYSEIIERKILEYFKIIYLDSTR